jgi:nitroimidazol reductase NimA-like FMN-containing flavoprotein (pyridoxamine 5'-phosphate oxidase superfamily)
MRQVEEQIRKQIISLLDSQSLAVLSTQRGGQPYSSLMAFAHADDLGTILVATSKVTRKHLNISANPRVSLLIDNRSNEDADFHAACAVTVLGSVEEVSDSERETYQSCYLACHPYLETFLAAPTTVFLKIIVRHYLLVNRFQHVMELHLTDEMDLFS